MTNFVGIIEGEKLLVKVGDGAVPEVFTHPCLINTTRGVNFTSNDTTTEVADCDNPQNPSKVVRKIRSIDFAVSGAGKLHKTDALAYINWWNSGIAKNVQIVQNDTGANGGWTGSGSMLLKDFAITGIKGDYQDCTINLIPAAPFSFVANA